MSDIEQLITMLQSDNPNKRYEACQLLKVAPRPLPQEAINALRVATNDKNPRISEAAQRVLVSQTSDKDGIQTDMMKLISSLIISIVISIGVTLLIVLIAAQFINLLHLDPDYGFILWLQVAPITAIVTLLISMYILLKRK